MGVREEKAALVEEVAQKLAASKSVIVADYRGLTVAEVTELRKNLREAGIEFRVIKNTLTRLATAKVNAQGLEEYLAGPTAIAFGIEDAVAPAKILNTFATTHKALEIKGGFVEGKAIDAEGVKALATLPSREGLISMFLSVIQAPVRNFAYAVKQISDQKESASA
nr:50S ribosomal protein L10 [Bacilli bacterium]